MAPYVRLALMHWDPFCITSLTTPSISSVKSEAVASFVKAEWYRDLFEYGVEKDTYITRRVDVYDTFFIV